MVVPAQPCVTKSSSKRPKMEKHQLGALWCRWSYPLRIVGLSDCLVGSGSSWSRPSCHRFVHQASLAVGMPGSGSAACHFLWRCLWFTRGFCAGKSYQFWGQRQTQLCSRSYPTFCLRTCNHRWSIFSTPLISRSLYSAVTILNCQSWSLAFIHLALNPTTVSEYNSQTFLLSDLRKVQSLFNGLLYTAWMGWVTTARRRDLLKSHRCSRDHTRTSGAWRDECRESMRSHSMIEPLRCCRRVDRIWPQRVSVLSCKLFGSQGAEFWCSARVSPLKLSFVKL